MKTTKDLPNFDSLSPADIENLAETARLEEASLEQIYSLLSQASLVEKLEIASMAILHRTETEIECNESACSNLVRQVTQDLLYQVSAEGRISLAIAILEGVQTESEADAIVPPDCVFLEQDLTAYQDAIA